MKVNVWNTKKQGWQFSIDDPEMCVTFYSRGLMTLNNENSRKSMLKLANIIKESFLYELDATGSKREAIEYIHKEFGL